MIKTPNLIIDPEWLVERIHDRSVRTVDLRDRDAFADRHIPGAVQLDLEDLGESRGGCENVLLPPASFKALMARLGITDRDTVVAYDEQWGLASARLVWALHHYGHQAAVVLNGGWDRWQEEGRPSTAELPPETPAGFKAGADPAVSADYEWISATVARGDVRLLDTRTQAEFDEGHLPGATCWDWFNAVPDGSWNCSRDPDELRSELAELGVHPSDEIVAYCRSGMRAAHTYVVLRHAGVPRVRLYDGSWQEWSMRREPDPAKGDDL